MDEGTELEAFCRRVYPRMVSALALHCGDLGVAEELTQEALVRVWDRWPSVEKMVSPEAWAYQVAFNLSTSRLRRRTAERRAMARLRVWAPPPEPDHADVIAIRAAVAALPERQRAAVILRFYAGLPVNEAATAMRCAPGTIKALTSQGIAGLRRRLSPDLELEPVDHA